MANTDLFSVQADDYAKFRPTYPDTLFNYLAGLCRERKVVWDCATGSGQAALTLTKYFDRVIGTDISQPLLDKAEKHEKITYKLVPAEKTGLDDRSVDLVTVAQALHWFDYDTFFPEVKRVLKPGGIFAAWGYTHLLTDAPVQKLTDYIHNELLKTTGRRRSTFSTGSTPTSRSRSSPCSRPRSRSARPSPLSNSSATWCPGRLPRSTSSRRGRTNCSGSSGR
jgi:SAM-dependent methyltransferase